MADPILVLHKVSVAGSGSADAKVFYCLLNPNTYVSIGTIVGISKASDTEQNNTRSDVGELIKAGIVFRLNLATKTTPKRYFHILCTRDKLGTALDGLVGKTINGKTVGAAKGRAKASFY